MKLTIEQPTLHHALEQAANQIRAAVQGRDVEQFTALMDAGRDWFDAR